MIIEVENLVKTYAGHTALDGLNFCVQVGDIFGFLGPNGAGKTTTIRILTGMIRPDSGIAVIDGRDVGTETMTIKGMINALPESNGYYEWMTAHEYLLFFSRLYKEKPSKAKIRHLLDIVGLKHKANHLIGSFSRGMKQRLGIARALVNEPKLLFLDEPTNGLDPGGRRDIHDLLVELNRRENKTIFISTHLLDDVDRLCNKIAILNCGKIVKIGDIQELKGKGTLEDIFFSTTREAA